MGLSANFSKKQLFKTIKTIVPKGEKMRQAFATAAKFGVKKGATGKLMQGQAVKLMKELKEEHVLKAHPQVSGRQISTVGETAKHLLANVTAPPSDTIATKAAAETAMRERLAEKTKINETMKAKTASEHEVVEGKKDVESKNVAAARGNDTVRAGQESAAAVEAEMEKRNGPLSDNRQFNIESHERSAPVQLTKTPLMTPRHEEASRVMIGGSIVPAQSSNTKGESLLPAETNNQPPPEPAKASDAIDIDIG